MGEYQFRAEQFISRPLDEVFSFFSRAENLQELTPEWLHFRILSIDPNPVRKGTFIRYAMRWRIIPIRWMSEIVEWDPPHRFIDVQRRGPYRTWHHQHRFVAENGGTRMFDVVHYSLPFGVLGGLAHRFHVESDVRSIFAYRKLAVERIFGKRD